MINRIGISSNMISITYEGPLLKESAIDICPIRVFLGHFRHWPTLFLDIGLHYFRKLYLKVAYPKVVEK